MNKTIKRRNLFGLASRMYDADPRRHVGFARKLQHERALNRWWQRTKGCDSQQLWGWSRAEKKAFLNPGDAYTKWKRRYTKHEKTDPNMPLIVGRHVLVPADACLSDDRKLRMSLVKANAQGRRRRG